MAQKRQCSGKNRRGEPCGSPPMLDADYCFAHNEALPDSHRFGRGEIQQRASSLGGKALKRPRVVDILRERLEEKYVEPVIAALVESLDAQKAIVTRDAEGNESVEFVTDHGTRIRAAEVMFDRGYGKPKQVTEVSGPDGEPIQLEAPLNAGDRSARAAALLAQSGLLEPADGATAGTNGHSNGKGRS